MPLKSQSAWIIIAAAVFACDGPVNPSVGVLPEDVAVEPEPAEPEPAEPEPAEPEPAEPEPAEPEPQVCEVDPAPAPAECVDCEGAHGFSAERIVTAWIPTALAAGDLNGDRRADVVAAHAGLSALSVRLTTTDGLLGPRVTYPVVGWPTAIALADFDGDEVLDLVAVSDGDRTRVSVFLGTGTGALQAAIVHETNTGNPADNSLAVADLDGDGVMDLLLGHTYNRGEALSVLRGVGDGTFEAAGRHLMGGSVIAVATADLDRDGHTDLVFAEDDGFGNDGLGVMLGVGEGRYAEPARYAGAGRIISPTDVNRDGLIDVVALGPGGARIWHTQPDGRLELRDAPLPAAATLLAGDLDLDGRVDLVTAEAGGVGVALGAGDEFEPTVLHPIERATAAVSADVNGDGAPDVVVAVADSGEIGVVLGQGDGRFETSSPRTEGVQPWASAAADLNGDGAPDLVHVYLNTDTLSVALGNGDGTFQPLVYHPVGDGPRSVAIGDLNGDCLPDLLVGNTVGDGLSLLFGVGQGRFAPQIVIPSEYWTSAVAIADINADGRADLLAAGWSDETGQRTGRLSVWLGRGDGQFDHHADHRAGNSPVGLAVADLNTDGALDVAVADFDRYRAGVSVLMGDGDGGLHAQRRITHHGAPSSVAVADMDGDGALDLVTADMDGNAMSVFNGRGDGTFAAPVSQISGNRPSSIGVADMDGDCLLDVVVLNAGTHDLTVFKGTPGGGLLRAPGLAVGASPRGLAIADFDQDGAPDLAAAQSGAAALSVLLNQGCDL